jgi:hypothetical protein
MFISRDLARGSDCAGEFVTTVKRTPAFETDVSHFEERGNMKPVVGPCCGMSNPTTLSNTTERVIKNVRLRTKMKNRFFTTTAADSQTFKEYLLTISRLRFIFLRSHSLWYIDWSSAYLISEVPIDSPQRGYELFVLYVRYY